MSVGADIRARGGDSKPNVPRRALASTPSQVRPAGEARVQSAHKKPAAGTLALGYRHDASTIIPVNTESARGV